MATELKVNKLIGCMDQSSRRLLENLEKERELRSPQVKVDKNGSSASGSLVSSISSSKNSDEKLLAVENKAKAREDMKRKLGVSSRQLSGRG